MVRKIAKAAKWMAAIAAIMLAGCPSSSGTSKVKVSEIGLTMELPAGWKVDRREPRFFFDKAKPDDNYGMIEDYSLEGKSLDEYVESSIRQILAMESLQQKLVEKLDEFAPGTAEFGELTQTRIVSNTPTTINGYEAIEPVIESDHMVIEVDIKKGDKIIRASFRTTKDDFTKYENSLRKALESIKIK